MSYFWYFKNILLRAPVFFYIGKSFVKHTRTGIFVWFEKKKSLSVNVLKNQVPILSAFHHLGKLTDRLKTFLFPKDINGKQKLYFNPDQN